MKAKIVYEDFSPGAKSDTGAYTSTDKQSFVSMDDLKAETATTFPNYALCLPMYSKIGSYINSPNTLATSGLGYMSTSISSSSKTFTSNLTIERTFANKYSSVGIVIGFNTVSGDYCDSINIKWYEDSTLLYDVDYTPDSTEYFCQKNVTNFNKVIIEFKKTSKANRYVWVSSIDYGIKRTFTTDEAKKIETLQEISQISEELTINTMNFTLFSLNTVDYMFQKTQAMKLYADTALQGTFYIDTAKRTASNEYEIKAKDAVGLLNEIQYTGGMYNATSVSTVLSDLFTGANLSYELDSSFSSSTLTGYLPIMSGRDALAWICMAIGAVADTAYSTKVKIVPLSNVTRETISKANQYIGTNVESLTKVTGAIVTGYKYTTNSTSTQLYNETLNGTATVTFSSPQHDLTITGGTITSSGTNYAIITGTGSTVTLTGQGYDVTTITKSMTNPSIGASDIQNDVTLANMYLINSSNIDAILTRVYTYYLKNKQINAKIILGNTTVKLGDKVNIVTDFDGTLTGVIEKMSNKYTNSIASEVVIR